jgi:hypothetical protein
MIRSAAAVAVTLAAILTGLSPARAAPPERVYSEVFNVDETVPDEFLTDLCGFPVSANIKGHYFERVFFNEDGSVNRFTAHPSFRSTLTSPYGSVSTADVGLDRFTENPDGTINVFGTGIHVKIQGGTKAIGLWRLVFDPSIGELVSEEYHGQFDVTADGTAQALCEALGPAA